MAKEMESGKYCNMGKYLTKSALYYLLQIVLFILIFLGKQFEI